MEAEKSKTKQSEQDIEVREHQASTAGISAPQETPSDFQKFAKQKLNLLEHSITRITQKLLNEATNETTELLKTLKRTKPNPSPTEAEFLQASIPYSDKINQLLKKLHNTVYTKDLLNKVCGAMIKHAGSKLTPSQSSAAKKNFDLICNYKKRGETGLENIGFVYDLDLCHYLIKKCFKKSAVDAYDSFFRVDLKKLNSGKSGENEEIVKIVSLGGGPGSDLSGAVSFLAEVWAQNPKKFECKILDYNHEKWSKSSKLALEKAFNAPKLGVAGFEVNWAFLDFTKPETLEQSSETIQAAKVITIAWAVNEAEVNHHFWTRFFELSIGSLVIFIEGKSDKLKVLKAICEQVYAGIGYSSLEIVAEFYESPRRLIKLPYLGEKSGAEQNQNSAKRVE